ncbi:phosphoesterase family-domain-containing protein [Cercophora newfieldiana]|uniref:Phosphoesterase family-domain-containing protein n=1 Tax=Cercophora newfieldiana TaxID=92897 RepID=A0AA40CU54_9PEZI|nr:phosphoesterase family-domain-containing protein [Cercophora newfieldiana]
MKQFLSLLALGATWFDVAGAKDSKGIVPGKAFERIITIWLENQDFAKVVLDSNIADLKRRGVLLDRYYAQTHPSQPNYLAALGGDYFGCNHDDFLRIPEKVFTITDLLESRNVSWAAYMEDMPGPGFMGDYSDGSTGNGGWDYVRKHNPFVSYDSITNDGERLLRILSFDDFQRDFAARRVPQFVFMTPNMMNDGHNSTLQAAAEWSHKFLQPLLADNAFDERTLIMLTFDESETYEEPNHIVTLLLGTAIRPVIKGTDDHTFYTHYSILSTVEYNWQLPNLGRYDVGANVFHFAADTGGGYRDNKDPENAAAVDNSVSYPGFLHNETDKHRPIPPPNLNLVGAGGQGVLEAIKNAWRADKGKSTPYDGSGRLYDGVKVLPIHKAPTP